ncbi:MAG: ABC transporter ATP-binding protein [Clostridia bacterium]|nr:ABC transporter ATP-binding protein [Clostridia bacterium]
MADYYFKTRQMTVGYDGVPLIRDITIDIARGEIVTLIGPNGSGKSTILKSITRQLKMLGGEVFIASEELRKLSYKALSTKMAVVLTERMKPELMTCRDIVATGRYPYTGRLGILTEEDELKVEAAMAAVHVLELRNRDFNAISDGQRQRVLLARAICQEPEIIVLDEPTSFLDIRHKLQLLSLLRGMAREKGITVIMSLHEIDLAQKISDRIVCVKGDHVLSSGTPEEVFGEDAMRELYGIDQGYYDPMFGSIELPRPEGAPATLVLSACGTGIPVYRMLQKRGIPFAAGILYTNDVDYRLARLLAAEVVAEEPFMPIGDEAFQKALAWVEACGQVIDAGVALGETNRRMAEVIDAAKRAGKYITVEDFAKRQ